MNKKICLITVSSPFLADEKVFYFIGILKVAAYWEKLGYTIDHIDLCGVANPLDVLADYFDKNKNLYFVGITATSPQYKQAHEAAQFIKKNYNHKLVLGGTHSTLSHTSYKKELKNGIKNGRASRAVQKILEDFDILVAGDGEFVLDDILNMDKGIIDNDDRLSNKFLKDKDLDDMPFPARHLLSMNDYKYSIEGERATNMILQLGCPFKCTFCCGRASPSLRAIRTRSIGNIIQEIEHLYNTYGFKGWNLFDDELNVNKDMVPLMYAIADLQSKLGVSFKLRGFTKAELFTKEQAKAMKTAGFSTLLTGFESAHPRILRNIKKNATVEDNTRCVEIAHEHGLRVKALLSCGHPAESAESIHATKEWAIKMAVEDVDFTVISPYPSSPVYDEAVKEGNYWVYRDKDNGDALYQQEVDFSTESNYYKSTPGSYISVVHTDYLTANELVNERDAAEEEVRRKLNLPYNKIDPAKKYNHESSMGQGNIPDWILRSTETHPAPSIEPSQPLDISNKITNIAPMSNKKSLTVIN